MPLDPVKTLQELVAIPSVNPMGRDVSGPEFFEHRLTNHLEGLFKKLGLPTFRQPIEPMRDNIVARFDGDAPGVLMFEAHQDTVPTDGMTIKPFEPVVRDGKIYGRGSCDIKGGMTAMLVAVSRLLEEKPKGLPTIVMACSVNEEHGYNGANQLRQLWEKEKFIPERPAAAVVAEPTLLDVVVAHKGAVRWRCRTRGKAAHSSQPHLGDNAAYKMALVLLAIEAYQRDVTPKMTKHPLCGQATISVGTIRGGISVNTVIDECVIEIDRRLLPGEDNDTAYQAIIDHIKNFPGVDFPVEHDKPYMDGATLSDDINGPLAERLSKVSERMYGRGKRIGVPYGTDASRISKSGVPCVVFGPGSIDQAHTCDEWLSIDELNKAADVLYNFAKEWKS